MTGNTRRSIFGIVLVAAAALAGCGGVAEQDDALTGAAVLQATRAAETARIATNVTMSMGDYTTTADGAGVEDFARQRGSMTFKTKSEGKLPVPPLPGDADGAGIPEADATLPPTEYEARWLDDVVYVGVGSFPTPDLFGKKKWLKFEPSEMYGDEDCAATASSALGFRMGTPINALDVLAANGNVLEDLGTEVVRDEETTHWRIEDPKPPPGCDAEEVGKVILELWTDTDKRARRILVTFDPETPSVTTSTTNPEDWMPPLRMTMTTDYFDFGTDVSVEEPPTNEVMDMSNGPLAEPTPADYGTPGAWTVAAEGTRDGEPWRVWTTKTSTGARCYDVENTAVLGIGSLLWEADTAAPKHQGRATACDIGPNGALAMVAGFTVLANIEADGQRTIVGASVDDAVQLVFADGTTADMSVDRETRVAQWRGTQPAGAIKVKTESGTCQLSFDLSGMINPTDINATNEALEKNDMGCVGSDLGIPGGIAVGAGSTPNPSP